MNFQHAATLFSAIAAAAAAAFAGVNLLLTGRRERMTWKRNALQGFLVDFTRAIYDHRAAALRIARNPTTEPDEQGDLSKWTTMLQGSEEQMLDALSGI